MTRLLIEYDVREHRERHEPEELQAEADGHGAQHARGRHDREEQHPRTRGARQRVTLGARPPQPVRHERVEEVAEEAEEIARTEAREEVADEIPDRRAPCGSRSEQERAHDRQRVRRAEVRQPGDERHDHERDQHRGVERRAHGRQHDHPRVVPHTEELAHGRLPGGAAAMVRSRLWGQGTQAHSHDALGVLAARMDALHSRSSW